MRRRPAPATPRPGRTEAGPFDSNGSEADEPPPGWHRRPSGIIAPGSRPRRRRGVRRARFVIAAILLAPLVATDLSKIAGAVTDVVTMLRTIAGDSGSERTTPQSPSPSLSNGSGPRPTFTLCGDPEPARLPVASVPLPAVLGSLSLPTRSGPRPVPELALANQALESPPATAALRRSGSARRLMSGGPGAQP